MDRAMKRSGLWVGGVVAAVVWGGAVGARGEDAASPRGSQASRPSLPAPRHDQPLGWTEAPGGYGTSWGTPSFGSVRTYSEFASPYGQGYGHGYPPSSILPGPYGAGIWSPGSPAASVLDTSTASKFSYRTFQVPYVKGSRNPVPPFGVYAPGFGPGIPGR
jgi:hypothetical protein